MTQPAAAVPSPSPSSVSEAGSTPSPTSQAVIASPSSESEDFASEVTPRPHDAIGRHESGDELLQSDASASDGEISSSDGEYSYSSDGEGHESVSHTASAESGSDRFHNAQEFVHPVAFKTKAEARAQLDGLENARFSVTSNSRLSTRLSCTTHVDCTAEARIKKERNGQFRLFRSGMHTTETVDVMAQRTGIHKPFLSEVDNLLLGGQGPRQCLITLQTKYIDNDETLALLPSVSQLKNRAHKLRKRGDFDITSYADIMVWASPRMCFTKATLFKDMSYRVEDDALRISHKPLEYQNELLVLD
ncbi:hypothetical protein PR001_g10391 [Phytophthora rubi]|uniref:Uncharacterized protein n=3 Tax=Phytophthora rubi TaxID=129364 RepID=A0A6A3M704_9STRA|nr:hypothetical protein PR002_g10582 [Phytophthora rubi]KAE9032891.1 hypothetical protein PR001_g10391 [Phytophthora rubi]